ncbi:hypothetical protein E1A91_A03G028400v1 [Gossypium mustelinum]|uniref:CLAVATA3/ESR-like protein n=4 Tax=Gossypium TaxID=3633 RepID=A0A5J5W8J3_GOSBA|nr:hypothetical protein ES319_A03G024100v1 [Gossypium barbadense]TYH23616.1 hypothetical protein ES288_A03G027800v1 [Gossypium darwinii]TYI34708.1 hypothetical protein ES332_A03G027600v1 [Gossypium tomentosum]TYJ41531.1 hypothetical protein E1A91_A03G028400v1 [Gossypium mustelinum]
MKICNPKSSFMFLMIILASITHLSSCHFIHRRSLSSEAEERSNTEFHTWHLPAKSPEPSSRAEKDQPVYQVSYRTVPGGPNPLHN